MVPYRRDIDGLRGLSVLAVILYHADLALFSGGFVGVDVFFVISGFLITSILLNDAKTKKFSLVKFYERRIRRIFPALFFMLLIVTGIAAVFLLPPDLKDYGQSLIAAAASLSNVHFWSEAGYFDMDSRTKPLLHTWSLGVEEQFYIFFPLFIWLVYRFKQQEKIPFLFGSIFLLSLSVSIWSTPIYPKFSFFLPATRAWELMLGGILALDRLPKIKNAALSNSMAFTGLAAVLAPVFLYSETTLFPGINALAPCLGAGMLIHSGIKRQTAIHKLLSLKPIVFIGLISYSLYLWHWPLFSLYRYYNVAPLSAAEILIVIFASAAISILSWHFIEKPFRGSTPAFSRRRIFVFAFLAVATACITGAVLYIANGFPQRVAPTVQATISVGREITANRDTCLLQRGQIELPPVESCLFGRKGSGSYNTVLWGDSHADQLVPGLEKHAEKNKFSGRRITKSACPPLLGAMRVEITGQERHDCKKFNDSVIDLLTNDVNIKTVILTARWTKYTEGQNRSNEGDFAYLTNENFKEPSKKNSRDVFSVALNETVKKLVTSGKKVILIGPVPEPGYPVPDCLAKTQSPLFKNLKCENPPKSVVDSDTRFSDETLKEIKKEFPQVSIYLPVEAICDENTCPVEIDGAPLYRDKDHLSFKGSEYLIEKLNLR